MSPLNAPKARKLSSLERKSLEARQRMGLEEVRVKLQVPSPDLSRALEIVKGDTGPQGPVGGTGPEGPRGLEGEIGLTGAHGEKGGTGETGARGQAGVAGAAAERGEIGPEGKIGPVGLTGVVGIEGKAGKDGVAGAAGRTGATGTTGVTGATGGQGEQGKQGEQGRHGTTVAGSPGTAGASGTKGDTGDRGLAGKQGIPGIPGVQGDLGDKGANEEVTKDVLKRLKELEEVSHEHRLFPRGKTVDRAFAGGIGYTDSDAIAAVEGEATLDLTGDASIADGKTLSLLTDGSTGGIKFGASEDVLLFRGAANRLDFATGDFLRIVNGSVEILGGNFFSVFGDFADSFPRADYGETSLQFGPGSGVTDVTLSRPSANTLQLAVGDTFEVDTIKETTTDGGVTIESNLLKDNDIIADSRNVHRYAYLV